MTKRKSQDLLVGEILDEHLRFTLDELRANAQAHMDFIEDLMEFSLIEPIDPQQMLFDARALLRLQRASRLHRDLNVNMEGLAIILDLLDEIEALKKNL